MIYVLIILIIILLVIHSYLVIDISRYTIKDKRIDKDIKMLLLSDLHNRDIKDKLSKIINKEKPDLIILSGDMINEFVGDQENFIKLIPILEKYKTYYTFGNHEEACIKELKNDYMNRLSKTKLILLNDDSVSLSKNIKLYGLDVDISFFEGLRKKKLDNKYIESRLGKLDNKKYNSSLIVVDTTPPEVSLKDVSITKGDSYSVKDFLSSYQDNSGSSSYTISFKSDEYSKINKVGNHSVTVTICDIYKNCVDKTATLVINEFILKVTKSYLI